VRVSEKQRYNLTGARVERAKEDNAKMLEVLSTQKKINRLSDGPIEVSQSIKEKSRIANQKQYLKNIEYSVGYLERAESAISGINDFLIRAKELSVAMANDTYGPDSRQATAREIKELRDAIISLANSSYGNRYVFGGFRTQTPPLNGEGQYMGDDGLIFLQLDENDFRQINVQSRQFFEPDADEKSKGHMGMIDTLDVLLTGLMEGDKDAIRKAMDELDYQVSRTTSHQATIGGISKALIEAQKRLELGQEISVETLSKLEDADLYEASSDFKRTETVLQGTLMASNKLLQPSLLNFMQ